MEKLEKGATSKCAFTETIWGVYSECCDVAELSTALPPQLLLPRGQIPFWLTAENCWHRLRRSPSQTTFFRRGVVAHWRHDSAVPRCHSSCLSQVGLQSHNSHFDCKQRVQLSVVRICGWLIVRAGCWKLVLWQHFVLRRMPFHNIIISTPPQTWMMLHSGELLTVCQMMSYNWVTSSLVCCFMHCWVGQDERERKRNEAGT